MNIKRFVFAAVALFAFIYLYEWFVHGVLLMDLYHQTENLWRAHDQMMAYMPFNLVLMGFIALWITFIFTQFYKDGGVANGLKFGFFIGILSAMQALGAYFYLPISCLLACSWFLAYAVESILGGIIIGIIYRK